MGSSKTNLYMFQFSYAYANQIYLPYSVGMLWTYARTIPEIEKNIENKGFIVPREEPEKVVERLENPQIAAFSTYMWNWEISVKVARLINERFPECLIIFGGPQVPNADRLENFFEHYPFIDIAVHGEGEITFSEILLAHINGQDYKTVPGLTYRGFTTEIRPRERDLNIFPSPYLTDVFDQLYKMPYHFHTVWETNRGCPYGCTFCDWGSLTAQRIYQFDEERLIKEMEYFAEKKISHVYMADANFGILPRDVELANRIVKIHQESGGYPEKLRVNYAKNDADRVFEISRILNKHNMDKGITLSVQSMDPETLLTIKRRNLKYDTLSAFIKRYQKEGIDTYTELIIGLAGETYESFVNGIESLLEAGAHDSLWIYRCSVLPNAPMNDKLYMEEHKIKTVRTPIYLNHTEPGKEPIQEYEDIVVETATLSKEDLLKCQYISWAIQTFHALGLLQIIAIYAKEIHNVRYTTFYEHVLEYSKKNPNTIMGKEFLKTKEKVDGVFYQKKPWDNIVPEYNTLTWSIDEASYLRFMLTLDAFFAELGGLLEYLEKNEKFSFDPKILEDILKYQKAILVKYETSGSVKLHTKCSIHSFHRNILTGNNVKLQHGEYLTEISDQYNFQGDKKRYSTEILIWGRRGGKTMYQTCKEISIQPQMKQKQVLK